MFKIEKVVINGAGNPQRTSVVGFVNCNFKDLADKIIRIYSALAKSGSLYYKLRGQNISVKYVFTEVIVSEIPSIVAKAEFIIKHNVENANEYIRTLNKAARVSNKKQLKKDDNLLEYINVGDYMFNVKPDVVIEDNKVIVG